VGQWVEFGYPLPARGGVQFSLHRGKLEQFQSYVDGNDVYRIRWDTNWWAQYHKAEWPPEAAVEETGRLDRQLKLSGKKAVRRPRQWRIVEHEVVVNEATPRTASAADGDPLAALVGEPLRAPAHAPLPAPPPFVVADDIAPGISVDLPPQRKRRVREVEPVGDGLESVVEISAGSRIEVLIPVEGEEPQFFCGSIRRMTKDGRVYIHFDDGDADVLRLEQEKWAPCPHKEHDCVADHGDRCLPKKRRRDH